MAWKKNRAGIEKKPLARSLLWHPSHPSLSRGCRGAKCKMGRFIKSEIRGVKFVQRGGSIPGLPAWGYFPSPSLPKKGNKVLKF